MHNFADVILSINDYMKGKKIGGRVKGTPNKITKEAKEWITDLLHDYQSSGLLDSDFASLEPMQRLLVVTKMLPYVAPKLQALAISNDGEKTLTIEERLIKMSQEPTD